MGKGSNDGEFPGRRHSKSKGMEVNNSLVHEKELQAVCCGLNVKSKAESKVV